MKVLHIISSSGMYGAEAVILNVMRVMRDGPHQSALAVFSNLSNPNQQLHEAALREGFESHLIPCQGQIDRKMIGAIRRLALATGADVVHAHGYKADIYVYFAFRKRGMPLVSTCHTWYDTDRMVTLYGKLDRLVLRAYTRVVAVSDEVRQRLLDARVRPDRIRMVRNGIDLRPFEAAVPLPAAELGAPAGGERPLVAGLVGRLSWEKGVDIFLPAAARVLAEEPGVRFVVAGDGPDREKLERQIDELGIRQSVTLLGRREDMPAVYASLDVMVSASRQEGLPMAILEGMASARPMVASAVGELPKVVVDGQTGLLVPPENVEALAGAMRTLLRDGGLRARFGAAARKRIEDEYSAGRMTAEYVRVYEEAIAVNGGASAADAMPAAQGMVR